MPTLLEINARRILLTALQSEYGIQVRVIAAPQLIAKTRRAATTLRRFKNEDALFADLNIKMAPQDPDNRLWIIRQDKIRIDGTQEPSPEPELGWTLSSDER